MGKRKCTDFPHPSRAPSLLLLLLLSEELLLLLLLLLLPASEMLPRRAELRRARRRNPTLLPLGQTCVACNAVLEPM